MDEDLVELPQSLPPIQGEMEFDARLRRLKDVTEEVKGKEDEIKELKATQEALSYSLAQYMLTSGCQSKILDGVKYTQKQRVFSKVEDKEALRAWIMNNDAVDMLMAVHPSKLTAYCNEQLEQGGETPSGVNPNYIKYYVHIK